MAAKHGPCLLTVKKDPAFRNQAHEETSPHLLLGSQVQRLGAEEDKFPRVSTGTFPGHELPGEGNFHGSDMSHATTASLFRTILHHHHHHHQSLNREGHWGTTDDFATSFLHFCLFTIALWDLPNSRPVHSLMLSSHLFLCPLCFLPPFTVPVSYTHLTLPTTRMV